MQILAFSLVLALPSAHDKLVLFSRDFEIAFRKSGDGQRDAQSVALSICALHALYVIGRIAVGGFGEPLERSLHGVETKQKRARKWRHARHRHVLQRATEGKNPDGILPDDADMVRAANKFKSA